MKSAFFLTPLAALTLSGCMSTPAYRCPIDGSESTARCTSTEQAYKASVASRGTNVEATSVFDLPQNQHLDKSGTKPRGQAVTPYFTGQATNYPAPPGNGAPVFHQPKVFQPWLAPYVDGDGNMRSGEYGYFSTPGRWNYGTLRKAGSSSDLFEPARPGDLGFQPVATAPKSTTPSRPASPPAAVSTPQLPAGQQVTPATQAQITQPYQRLKMD